LRENQRIVMMFCAFNESPKIVRLHGIGRVVLPDTPEWPRLRAQFPAYQGARAIIDIDVSRISDSCGFGVPMVADLTERDTLLRWADKKGPELLRDYRRQNNAKSIDGLPALDP
jgi:hypothetical protein